jgi:ribosome maturation factor RimP
MNSNQIREVVEGCVKRRGAHVIDLVMRGESGTRVMEVFIDAEEGVTTEVCADVSRALVTDLRGAGFRIDDYHLTVSSPGIDRPLRHRWQYGKHIGRTINVKFTDGDAGRECRGTLTSVDVEGITVIPSKSAEAVVIPFDAIVEARIVAPW